jgi:muramidase (phage lysozyme)
LNSRKLIAWKLSIILLFYLQFKLFHFTKENSVNRHTAFCLERSRLTERTISQSEISSYRPKDIFSILVCRDLTKHPRNIVHFFVIHTALLSWSNYHIEI